MRGSERGYTPKCCRKGCNIECLTRTKQDMTTVGSLVIWSAGPGQRLSFQFHCSSDVMLTATPRLNELFQTEHTRFCQVTQELGLQQLLLPQRTTMPPGYGFGHLWQQEELSDVDLVLLQQPADDDEPSTEAGASAVVLQRMPAHSTILSLSPFLRAMVSCPAACISH